jgi:proteasome lid subunit RPN8/RPN11
MKNLTSGIVLSPEHYAQMETDVNIRSSEEACGFVVGIGSYSKLVIPVTNIIHDPHRFRMDPQEELNAFLLTDQKGWEVLAIYHSHPHGITRPSITDHAELTFPGVIYLIWFQQDDAWQCRGYLMQPQGGEVEVPVIISTNK